MDRRAAVPLAFVAIVLANVFGGISYPAQKLALAGLPPVTVTLARTVIAVVALALVVRARGGMRWERWTRADLRRIALVGSCAFGLPMVLGIVGVQYAPSGNAAILILLEPVTILVLAWFFLHEAIRPVQFLGVGIGLVGASFLVFEGGSLGDLFGGEHLGGNAILALHAVLWGCCTPLAKPISAKHDPFEVTYLTMVFAGLPLIPALWFDVGRWQAGPGLVPAILWTLMLGLLISFVGSLLWLGSLRHLQAATVAPMVFIQPVAGVLAGWLWLDERLSPAAIGGGALIAGGCGLVLFLPRRRHPRVPVEV
jgi:drug/metabolite transporter (DMT)-like permease